MGRKRGFDRQKIAKIIGIMASNPEGIWLRQIARESKIHHSTVAKYIDTILKPLVEDVSLGGTGKPLLRVIRLKPFVLEKLQEGRSIEQVMKVLRLMDKLS